MIAYSDLNDELWNVSREVSEGAMFALQCRCSGLRRGFPCHSQSVRRELVRRAEAWADQRKSGQRRDRPPRGRSEGGPATRERADNASEAAAGRKRRRRSRGERRRAAGRSRGDDARDEAPAPRLLLAPPTADGPPDLPREDDEATVVGDSDSEATVVEDDVKVKTKPSSNPRDVARPAALSRDVCYPCGSRIWAATRPFAGERGALPPASPRAVS